MFRCNGMTCAPCASAASISAHCCIMARRSGRYPALLWAPRTSFRSQRVSWRSMASGGRLIALRDGAF
jgi:hypothetical protein